MQCGVFGRWYKRKDDDSSLGRSTETIDGSRSGSTFAPRTIPPLPGMKPEGGVQDDQGDEEVKEDLDTDKATRKAEEAEIERQLEVAASVSPAHTDPHLKGMTL